MVVAMAFIDVMTVEEALTGAVSSVMTLTLIANVGCGCSYCFRLSRTSFR